MTLTSLELNEAAVREKQLEEKEKSREQWQKMYQEKVVRVGELESSLAKKETEIQFYIAQNPKQLKYCHIHKTIGVFIKDKLPCCIIAELRKQIADLTAKLEEKEEAIKSLQADLEGLRARYDQVCEVSFNMREKAEEAFNNWKKAEARLHEVYEILKDAGEAVCSRCCPSTWETGSQQLHSELCKRIRGMR